MPSIPTPSKLREVIKGFDEHAKAELERGDDAVKAYRASDLNRQEGALYYDQPPPVNLTFRGANVLVAHLAANDPKHAVKARRAELSGDALLHSLRLDYLNDDLRRVEISRQGLLNCLLRGRTVKRVGLRSGSDMLKMNGREYDPGQPYIKVVPNHRHGYDWTAESRQMMQWEFERYVVSRERALAAGIFRPGILKQMKSVAEATDEARKTSRLFAGDAPKEEHYLEDMVELMDFFLYDPDGPWYMLTLPADPEEAGDYLRVQTIDPIQEGVFIWEEFYPESEGVGAISWAQMSRMQEALCTRLANKVVEQAEHIKHIIFTALNTSDEEIQAAKNAKNFDVLRVADPSAWSSVDIGAISKDVQAMLGVVMQWWNVQAGQIDQLSGQSDSEKTATQFSGEAANASTIMSHLKRVHLEHEERCSRALAQHVMNDPRPALSIAAQVSKDEIVQLPYSPLEMSGRLNDFEFKIRPTSMPAQDPAVLLRRVIEFVQIAAGLQQLDARAAARKIGEIGGIEDLNELVPDPVADYEMATALNTLQGLPPPPPPGAPGMGGAPGAPVGPRAAQAPATSNAQTKPIGAVRSAQARKVPA